MQYSNNKRKEGTIRQIAMGLLYRPGGLKGQEIGNMFDIDYSTVSVSRKRLRNKVQKDHDLRRLLSTPMRFIDIKGDTYLMAI